MRKESGHTVQSIYSVLVLGAFSSNLICYLGVWIAVVSSSKRIKVQFLFGLRVYYSQVHIGSIRGPNVL